MKIYGHTRSLFIQGGKFKWSYKHDHCIKCGNCNYIHKGRGLCTRCWDKERDKTPARQDTKYKAGIKWHQENYKPVLERKKRVKIFNQKEYQKEWYLKNKEVLQLKAKAYRMNKQGLNPMSFIVNGKTRYLPFAEMLEKPNTSGGTDFTKYDIWKEQQRQFSLLKTYYERKRSKRMLK